MALRTNTFRFIGDADDVQILDEAVEIVSAGDRLQLAVVADGVFRVRAATGEDASFAEPPFSYAIDPGFSPGAMVPAISRHPGNLEISHGELRAVISLNPVRVSFIDDLGNILAEDELGIGWLGRRFNVWKRAGRADRFYGLGEKAYSLDRTGRYFTNWNTDAPGYDLETDPLYKSIPFFLVLTGTDGENPVAYGVFFDNTFRASFDFGGQARGRFSFGAEGGEAVYYVIAGPRIADVLQRYTLLTGRSPLPPMWSLGYHQSRWSYYPESDVRLLVDQFRARRIPLDVVHLDIHHMDGYRVFTWDVDRFPDPEKLLSDLREKGVKVVTIVDPGIKADPSYHVCAEGLVKGAFVRYPDGSVYEGRVWPGECYFPDFTSPAAREWFGGYCRAAVQSGVAGFWTDMNEPSNHSGRALPDHVLHEMDGHGGTHLEAHNVYGLQMARSVFEGALSGQPDDRPFVLTRSAYAGIQRYASVWTGDNISSWEHLEMALPMLLSIGLSGIPFAGSDVGGFFGNPTPELAVRWMQLGVFQPLFRNHTIRDSLRQEPWTFGEEAEAAAKRAVELRYRLLPLIYTLFHEHTRTGLPIMRPLLVHYQDDPRAHSLDDEFLLGNQVLVAPVLTPGTGGRSVYLPAGTWYEFETPFAHEGPTTMLVPAGLSDVPMFVRSGSVIPQAPVLQYTGEREIASLKLDVYPGSGISILYDDDGRTTSYRSGAYHHHRFEMRQTAERLVIRHEIEGAYESPIREFEIELMVRLPGVRASVDGKSVPCENASQSQRVQLRVPASFQELEFELVRTAQTGKDTARDSS